MRRQVTVGGLVALALLTGSVVAFAQPPVPAECAPADAEVAREGLVPRAQDDPDEPSAADEPTGEDAEPPPADEPSDEDPEPADEPAGEDPEDPAASDPADEPTADEPAADEPADDEPADEPADDEPADEPADNEPAAEPGADEPADDEPAADEPADDEPAADEPADDDPMGADPAGDEPAGERPNRADPATGADDPAADTDPCVTDAEQTAAAALDWGTPTREDDFDGRLDRAWEVYTGTGFDGQGTRTADALTTRDGILTITGDAEGATGGMAWGPGQMYGRWEARVRTPEADPSYNALLLLWPDDESGAGSEVDFMEMLDPTRQSANAFLHSGGETVEPMGEVAVDATEWHNWAVEWTPTSITAYLDGVEWWTVDDPDLLPQGPMHLCVQLDWFPAGDAEVQESSMQVDWVREYAVDAPAPADDPATGEEPADDMPADDAAGNSGDAGAGDDGNTGDGAGGSGDDSGDGGTGDGSGDGDSGDGDSGDGDSGDGDSGDGDGDRDGKDAEGVPSASLREGAPDSPARSGLVTEAVSAPRG